MRNGKEITVLVIMILVVLVSTVKAEEDLFPFEIKREAENGLFGLNNSNQESGIFSRKDLRIGGDSNFKICVDVPSELSDISDDYGLVVTISKSF